MHKSGNNITRKSTAKRDLRDNRRKCRRDKRNPKLLKQKRSFNLAKGIKKIETLSGFQNKRFYTNRIRKYQHKINSLKKMKRQTKKSGKLNLRNKNLRLQYLRNRIKKHTKRQRWFKKLTFKKNKLIKALKKLNKSMIKRQKYINEKKKVNQIIYQINKKLNWRGGFNHHKVSEQMNRHYGINSHIKKKMKVELNLQRNESKKRVSQENCETTKVKRSDSFRKIVDFFLDHNNDSFSGKNTKYFKIIWKEAKKMYKNEILMKLIIKEIINKHRSNIENILKLVKKVDKKFYDTIKTGELQNLKNEEINAIVKYSHMKNSITNKLGIMNRVIKVSKKQNRLNSQSINVEGEEYKLVNCSVFSKAFLGYSKRKGVDLDQRFDKGFKFKGYKVNKNIDKKKLLGKPDLEFNPFYGLSNQENQKYIRVIPQYKKQDLQSISVMVQVNEKIDHRNPEVEKEYFFFRSYVIQRTCMTLMIQKPAKRGRAKNNRRSSTNPFSRKRILEISNKSDSYSPPPSQVNSGDKYLFSTSGNFDKDLMSNNPIGEEGNIDVDIVGEGINQENLMDMVYNMTQPSINYLKYENIHTSSFSTNIQGFSNDLGESMRHLNSYFLNSEIHSFETTVLDSDPEKGFVVFSGDF